jgi:flagellar hook-associated protein 3 FlgL
MQTTLTHIDQYLDNNIADANAWLEVTDTALKNMTTILESIRTQCVDGATDTLKQDNRKTILQQLEQMADQVYSEGNADYAGRTIFTGYRTTSQLTFQEDETDTTYEIDQTFSYKDLEEHRYYYGSVETPATADDNAPSLESIGTETYERFRLAYGGDENSVLEKLSFTYSEEKKRDVIPTDGSVQIYDSQKDWEQAKEDGSFVEGKSYYIDDGTGNGTLVTIENKTIGTDIKCYDTLDDWEEAWNKEKADTGDDTLAMLGSGKMVYIRSTGELIMGSDVAQSLKDLKADLNVTYQKTGFSEGEARPEYYYDCRDITDAKNTITYEKEDQPINYEISSGIYLAANTQASEVLDTSIGREVSELITVVNAAISAHDTLDEIQNMLDSELYQDDASQEKLQKYKEAAKKVADYADDNMQKTFSQGITDFNSYLEKVNIAQTNVGCKQDRLSLTKTRVENQKETVEELKTENDNRDISDIIIDYYAAYNAYTASLTAASKVNSQTLLNYI